MPGLLGARQRYEVTSAPADPLEELVEIFTALSLIFINYFQYILNYLEIIHELKVFILHNYRVMAKYVAIYTINISSISQRRYMLSAFLSKNHLHNVFRVVKLKDVIEIMVPDQANAA